MGSLVGLAEPARFALLSRRARPYATLWELLRAEGLDNHIPDEDGSRVSLPSSVWAKTVEPGDSVRHVRDDISDHLTALVRLAGLKAQLLVMVCHNWAWRISNPEPANFERMLAAIFDKQLKSA